MKKKQLLSLTLAAMMAAASLTGCGGTADNSEKGGDTAKQEAENKDDGKEAEGDTQQETGEGKTKYPRNEEGFPDLQGETITIWFSMTEDNVKATNDMGEYNAIKWLEEKCNCNLEFISPPYGQAKDNFTIMMAEEKLPDMIFCNGMNNYPGKVPAAYEDGVLFDYTDYIGEEYTPNYYKLIKDDPEFLKMVTDDTGRNIGLGLKVQGSKECDISLRGPLIRKDYLEATGLAVPETIDEWTEMLAAMKANGVEYPLCIDQNVMWGDIFANAYGLGGNLKCYKNEEGEVVYPAYEDAWRDYLKQMNEWYEAGYINPDFLSNSETDVISMLNGDRVGSTVTHLCYYQLNYYGATEQENPEKALIPAPLPVLHKGDKLQALRPSSRGFDDSKYITSDATNPEACIALLDVLYLNEVNRIMAYGMEGKGWEYVDGELVPHRYQEEELTPEIRLDMAPTQMHMYEDTDLEFLLAKAYNAGQVPDAVRLWKEQGTDQTLSRYKRYTLEEEEIKKGFAGDLDTYVRENSMKFVLGQKPFDEFDEFHQMLKELQVEKQIEIDKNAEERYQNR